ncbi:MAG: HAMP domain-containing histidine kinase [Muribaculaceae bacterium]|nr:HAMP domain-containing histidine kinase [Muribaculaceae bacterium]
MKHFRLNILFLIAGIIIFSGLSAILMMKGKVAQGCLMFIPVIICAATLWRLQSRLISTMSAFVTALEMNDSTLRVEAGGDNALKEMSEAMNRISELHHYNMKELHTRKLYYDRVLKIVTHEMRNGITPIAAISADMKMHPERYQGETLCEASLLLHSQAEGILRFLDSYYSLTHVPEPDPKPINAGEYFHNVKRLANAELERRHLPENTIIYTIPPDMTLHIDAALMNQVLINLLRNALDSLSHEEGETCECSVTVVLSVSDTRPFLTISDRGCGMPRDVIYNLFLPFFTTKKDGSGVGLPISRQIIMRHGGDIRIQSKPGKGTSVYITL